MDQFVREYSMAIAAALFAVGVVLGRVLELWSKRMCRQFRLEMKYEPVEYRGLKLPATELLTGLLFAGYFLAVFQFGAHDTENVLPSHFWKYGRAVGHFVLIALLVAATATDFREYIIPEQITFPGTILGIGLAVISGDVQLMHLWVDWNQEIPGFRGAYIPDWIKESHHLHGLAWSLAGLVAGAGITWVVREISSRVLGQEALGSGDVTLMAMIGSFVGWQPVVFVFLLAPLGGIVAGLGVRLIAKRTYIPYGPYLAMSTIAVLFGWRWLWMLEISGTISIRRFFGDAPGLGILAGISLVAFVGLLASVRLYRSIPTERDSASGPHEAESEDASENAEDMDAS